MGRPWIWWISIVVWSGLAWSDPGHQVQPVPAAERERLCLSDFYQKCIVAGGLPLLGSHRVSDHALLEAAYLIDRMLEGREDIRQALVESRTRFVVMAPDEWTTMIPEHSDLYPRRYWDKRARGLGATTIRPAVSCGEENLLEYPGDPYSTENILVHEFAHAIHEMGLVRVDPGFDARLRETYEAAKSEGRWEGTYALSNRMEYWAEGVQSYFDTNRENDGQHNHVNTRSELEAHDPRLAALIREVFGDGEWRYRKPSLREKREHLADHVRDPDRRFEWPPALLTQHAEHLRSQRAARKREGESEIDHLRRRAGAGDATSQVELGHRYRDGRGVEPDDRQAVHWYRRAAEQRDPYGEDGLGWMIQAGRGVDAPDEEEARDLFRRAAVGANVQGMMNLAGTLRRGQPTAAMIREAYAWTWIAASRGQPAAIREIGGWSPALDSDEVAAARKLAHERFQAITEGRYR